MSEANDITAALLEKIPARYPQIRVWRNNRIKAMAPGRGGKMRLVSSGVNGQADLSGIIGGSGRRLELEVKAGRDRLSEDQVSFGSMILLLGGVYIVAHSADEGLNLLAMALREDERAFTGPGLQSAAEIVNSAGGVEAFLRRQQSEKTTAFETEETSETHRA